MGQNGASERSEYLNRKEAARFIRRHPKAIDRLVRRGKLHRFTNILSESLFRRSDLENIIRPREAR